MYCLWTWNTHRAEFVRTLRVSDVHVEAIFPDDLLLKEWVQKTKARNSCKTAKNKGAQIIRRHSFSWHTIPVLISITIYTLSYYKGRLRLTRRKSQEVSWCVYIFCDQISWGHDRRICMYFATNFRGDTTGVYVWYRYLRLEDINKLFNEVLLPIVLVAVVLKPFLINAIICDCFDRQRRCRNFIL